MKTQEPIPTQAGVPPARHRAADHAAGSMVARRLMLLLALGAALIANVRIGMHLAMSPALAATETEPAARDIQANEKAPHPQVAEAAEQLLATTGPLLEAAIEASSIATAMLSDDRGRRVAANPAGITSFTRLRSDLTVSYHAARNLHDDAGAELRRNAGGAGRSPHAPLARLAVLRQRAGKLAEKLDRQRRRLEALAASQAPPTDVTLAEAIALMQRQQELELLSALEQQEQYLDHMEQLKRECKQPYVMGVLKPFTTPSRRLDGEIHAEPRRYSLQYLQSTGALQPTPYGKMRLVRCAVSTELRPPAWTDLLTDDAVQPELWNENQSRRVNNAQALLRKYGAALVELGLLEP